MFVADSVSRNWMASSSLFNFDVQLMQNILAAGLHLSSTQQRWRGTFTD